MQNPFAKGWPRGGAALQGRGSGRRAQRGPKLLDQRDLTPSSHPPPSAPLAATKLANAV